MAQGERLPFVLRLSKDGDGSRPLMVLDGAHHERVVLTNMEASYSCLRSDCPGGCRFQSCKALCYSKIKKHDKCWFMITKGPSSEEEHEAASEPDGGRQLTNPSGKRPTAFQQLKDRVAALEAEVAELRSSLTDGEVIELRTISRKEAKQEILNLFQSGETLYYSDLAERLRIDLPLVVEICQELEKEGEIEVNADAI